MFKAWFKTHKYYTKYLTNDPHLKTKPTLASIISYAKYLTYCEHRVQHWSGGAATGLVLDVGDNIMSSHVPSSVDTDRRRPNTF